MTDNAPAGATPAAAGATLAQTTPVSPAADPVTPSSATDDAAALGEPGKRALDAMKAERDNATKAAKAAEKALEDLKTASSSDAEKALKAAKAEGAQEVSERLNARIRRSEVKVALAAAGINPSVLDLAVNASEFGALTVSEDGEVEGLDTAVALFKGTRGDLFKPLIQTGSADLGTGTAARSAGAKTFTREQLRDPAFFAANRDDIMEAQKAGRITG